MSGKLIDFSVDMLYQMLIQGASFLIFFLLIKKFFFDKVVDIINKRKELINNEFEKADEASKEAQKLQEEYSLKIKSHKEELDLLTKKTNEELDLTKKEALKEAKEKSDKLISDAKKQIENLKVSAYREMKGEMVEISFDVATKVLEENIDKNAHKKLIDEALLRIEEN